MKEQVKEQIKIRNGCIEFEGKNYIYLKQAYLGYKGKDCYMATAICETDKEEEGWQRVYEVTWNILDDYDPEYMQEEMACDWDKPESIEECGEWNIAEYEKEFESKIEKQERVKKEAVFGKKICVPKM